MIFEDDKLTSSLSFTRRPEPERGGHGSVGLHRREVLAVEGDVQLPQAAAEEPLPLRHVCLSHQRAWSLRRRSGISSLTVMQEKTYEVPQRSFCSFLSQLEDALVMLRCTGRDVFYVSMLLAMKHLT